LYYDYLYCQFFPLGAGEEGKDKEWKGGLDLKILAGDLRARFNRENKVLRLKFKRPFQHGLLAQGSWGRKKRESRLTLSLSFRTPPFSSVPLSRLVGSCSLRVIGQDI